MARDLAGEEIKALMLDGEHMAERCVVVALAITADGTKKPVGLWDGSTENKTVVLNRRRQTATQRCLKTQDKSQRPSDQGSLRRGRDFARQRWPFGQFHLTRAGGFVG